MPQCTTDQVFQFLPGEQVFYIYGQQAGDAEPCKVIRQDGPNVTIQFQIFGKGPVHTKTVNFKQLAWESGSATGQRHDKWQAELTKAP
jgi:hypothetical protein